MVGTRQVVGDYILTETLPMDARAHVLLEFDSVTDDWWAWSMAGAFHAPKRLLEWHHIRDAHVTGRGNAARENPERPL